MSDVSADEAPALETLAAADDLETLVVHAAELVQRAVHLEVRLATAESCTGGLLGHLLTEAPGASGAYLGGWIVYANARKEHDLGVPHELIVDHGAVSAPVARALAEGALERSGADVAVATTGIAGPSGGTADKPVGTVFLGIARRGHANAHRAVAPTGDRAAHKRAFAGRALELLGDAVTQVATERQSLV